MNEQIVNKTSKYFKEKGVVLPKISELQNPHIINEDIKLIEQICNKFSKTVIANINSHNQIIVSGPISELNKSIELFKNNNIKKIIKLNVSGAFHSPLMEEANLSLKKVINSVNFSDTTVPIYQNVSSIKTFKGKEIKNNLSNQLTGSVLWYQTILNMKKEYMGIKIQIENEYEG